MRSKETNLVVHKRCWYAADWNIRVLQSHYLRAATHSLVRVRDDTNLHASRLRVDQSTSKL